MRWSFSFAVRTNSLRLSPSMCTDARYLGGQRGTCFATSLPRPRRTAVPAASHVRFPLRPPLASVTPALSYRRRTAARAKLPGPRTSGGASGDRSGVAGEGSRAGPAGGRLPQPERMLVALKATPPGRHRAALRATRDALAGLLAQLLMVPRASSAYVAAGAGTNSSPPRAIRAPIVNFRASSGTWSLTSSHVGSRQPLSFRDYAVCRERHRSPVCVVAQASQVGAQLGDLCGQRAYQGSTGHRGRRVRRGVAE